MKHLSLWIFLSIFLGGRMTSVAAEWQWSVQIPSMISQETEAHPQAFLWIPDDCGLPVYYYVKEGPATIKGDKLIFTKIPPRSKYPLRVTVVAWQYGIIGNVQTAEPVERTFFIEK